MHDMSDTKTKIKRIVCDQFNIDEQGFNEQTQFEDLGDSLDRMELIIRLEDQFSIAIEDKDIDILQTVDQAVSYISSHKR